jgi:hypothetical protein
MQPPRPRAITPSDLNAIIKSDVALYPTNSPLTPFILGQWFEKHPEFGTIYDNGLGCAIIVALVRSAWQKFVANEIEEAGLVDGIFDAAKSADGEIYLHLYHVEKSTSWSRDYPRMGIVVLNDLQHILRDVAHKRQHVYGFLATPLKVMGFSALAVSEAGFTLCRDIFRMTLVREPREFLYRHKTTKELIVLEKGSVVNSSEWIKESETRLMAVEGREACSFLYQPNDNV